MSRVGLLFSSVFSAAVALISASGASAQTVGSLKDATVETRWNGIGFAAGISLGVMHGEANEYVFDPATGQKISQLIWKFDENIVFGADLAVRPLHWLTLGVNAWFPITDNSTMDDFDFVSLGGMCPIVDGGFLCHSHHSDTELKDSYMVDIYAAATVYRTPHAALSVLAGYKWDHFKWEAFGGTSNYGGVFVPGELTIRYEQWWEAPFIGLGLDGKWDRWTFAGKVIGSWWVDSHDRDDHVLRSTLFTDEFDDSDMIAVNLDVGYTLAHNISVTVGYDYQKWFRAEGPTVINRYDVDIITVIPGDAAGADQESHIVSVGAKVQLN